MNRSEKFSKADVFGIISAAAGGVYFNVIAGNVISSKKIIEDKFFFVLRDHSNSLKEISQTNYHLHTFYRYAIFIFAAYILVKFIIIMKKKG